MKLYFVIESHRLRKFRLGFLHQGLNRKLYTCAGVFDQSQFFYSWARHSGSPKFPKCVNDRDSSRQSYYVFLRNYGLNFVIKGFTRIFVICKGVFKKKSLMRSLRWNPKNLKRLQKFFLTENGVQFHLCRYEPEFLQPGLNQTLLYVVCI